MHVGFIGLGNVGAKLAGSLLRYRHTVEVHDASREAANRLIAAGASWAETPRLMAERCDALITCLPSLAVSAEVLEQPDGVLAGLGPGKLWIEMSTTEVADLRRLGELVETRGSAAIDAPVSGGCHRAATGNITIFAGATRDAFERALPLLSAMGRDIVHTGALGSASILKVITNYLAGVQLLSSGEALMVAKKAGIDLGIAYDAIRASAGNSYTHETEVQMVLSGVFKMNFTMDYELKDLTLFDELGRGLRVPLELSPLCVDIVKDGIRRYGPKAWSPEIVRRMEEACGEELRAEGFPVEMVDHAPESPGREVTPGQRNAARR